MATEIKVPGVLVTGTGDHAIETKQIKDTALKKIQSELNQSIDSHRTFVAVENQDRIGTEFLNYDIIYVKQGGDLTAIIVTIREQSSIGSLIRITGAPWKVLIADIAANADTWEDLTAAINDKTARALISTGSGGSVTVDAAMSDSSPNPVQNMVIKAAIEAEALARQKADEELQKAVGSGAQPLNNLEIEEILV